MYALSPKEHVPAEKINVLRRVNGLQVQVQADKANDLLAVKCGAWCKYNTKCICSQHYDGNAKEQHIKGNNCSDVLYKCIKDNPTVTKTFENPTFEKFL